MITKKPVLNKEAVLKIDSREHNERIETIIDCFGAENTIVGLLNTGDYIYKDQVVIEYKTAIDMVGSIISKRIFSQVKRMRLEYPYHYILVEGDMVSTIVERQLKHGKGFGVRQWDGAYSSLNQVTDFIFANNVLHACHLMKLHFNKCLDGKNRDYTYLEKYSNPCLTFLSSIPKIGYSKAEKIVDNLNIEKLNDLLNLSSEDLISVDGIGIKSATIIMKAMT